MRSRRGTSVVTSQRTVIIAGPYTQAGAEEIFEAIRAELAKSNTEVARSRKVLENPYATHEHRQDYDKAFGRSCGLARALEVIEALP